jgi:outer membrane receptor protein involved in Fe transport
MPRTVVALPFCDPDSCDVGGNLNETNIASALPSLRLNVPVSWGLEGHLVTFIVHVIGGLEDWAPTRYDLATAQQRTVDSFVTLDLQYAYLLKDVIGSATQMRIGVNNLLDQAPPFVDVLDSYAATLHDPRGRIVYASIAQEF